MKNLLLATFILGALGAWSQAKFQPSILEIRKESNDAFPRFIRFDESVSVAPENHAAWLKEVFQLPAEFTLQFNRRMTDQLGWDHYTYNVFYKNVEVRHNVINVHMNGSRVISVNAELYKVLGSATPSIGADQSVEAALRFIDAERYKWQMPDEERLLKSENNDPNATYYPRPELMWYRSNAQASPQLVYGMDIYADAPLSRSFVYVDAHTNSVLATENRIHTADSNGIAVTAYSGNRSIVADYFSSQFRLRETGRGNGIQTYDLNNTSNYGAAVDFIDADNYWNNTANMDHYAGDAHWGAEMTYDYFWQIHNRNSIDGNGFTLKSYMHYNTNYNNAFWDGQRMTYGDGNGSTFTPLTAIDITGHEIAHGLTSNTSNLVYANESGALNESFSDIFGVAVESFANNNALNWIMGEDATPNGNGIRNMANPNAFNDPDTYLGTHYYTGSQDNGGVHTNSGVQNFWYYLLTVGGSGTNDINALYNVAALGSLKAARIAFRNNTVYLTPNSDYSDARFYAIQSAIDLYGACSPEVMSTTNAWHAVGVGQPFSYSVTSQFSTAFQDYCQAPALVNFTNESFNAGTFQWNFGDGGTSNQLNPSHTYQNPGLYTVTLIASGGACGTDTLILVDYINVDPSLPCAITLNPAGLNQTQTSCSGTLFDPGGVGANYQDLVTSEITIAPIGAATVTLNFSLFDLELNYDYLYIYDGPTNSSPLIGQYTGNTLPNGGTIQSTYGAITLKFFSDTYVTNAGFVMTWACQIPSNPPVADFEANATTSCTGEITFEDQTTGGPNAWNWNFGDGSTSTLQNPTHVYQQDGTYTVTLIASNNIGSDTFALQNYITIDRPDAPVANGVILCSPDSVTVQASANGEIRYFDAAVDGNLLDTGAFYSMFLAQTDTLWVENFETNPMLYVGPLNNSFGTGGQHNNASTQYQIFSVQEPLTIVSAWVNAGSTGDRTITLWDASGNQLDSRFLNIPSGGSRISLNFHLEPGVNYRMGGAQMNLYRNNTGATYPYQIPGLISITGSSAGAAFYYYFYDWEVVKDPCISPRTPVYLVMDEVNAAASLSSFGMTATVVANASNNATQYSWDFGDNSTYAQATPQHTYAQPGTYTVTLVASNDHCSDTAYFEATVDNAGLSEVSPSGWAIYPNPTVEALTVRSFGEEPEYYSIFDAQGRLVREGGMSGMLASIRVQNLERGAYQLQLQFSSGKTSRKSFVKMD
jgi:Zn-dependent metalloprotease/PKD repeat protein